MSLSSTLTRILIRLFFGRKERPPKLHPDELQRVLLIRYDRLGDMVISLPVVQKLKEIAPHVEIDVVAGFANSQFIIADPRIARVHLWTPSLFDRWKLIRECRKRRYDLTLQLILGRTTLPGLLARLATPNGRIVGRDSDKNRELFDYTVEVDTEAHFAEQTFSLLEGGIEGKFTSEVTDYPISLTAEHEITAHKLLDSIGQESEGYIALNISGGFDHKMLSEESYVDLVRHLNSLAAPHHLSVVITCAPEHRDLANAIAEAADGAYPLFFPSLPSLAVAIRDAHMYVTPDTGTLHIASAVLTPTVVWYGTSGDPAGWGPRFVQHRIVEPEPQADAKTIEPSTIAEECRDLLNSIIAEK